MEMRFRLAVGLVALLLITPPLRGRDVPASQPASRPAAVTRIACIGDSITFGAGLKDRQHEAYPAQLQQMLGERYHVENFGVSGATLLRKGDRPYWDQKRFAAAKESAPYIVVIKLGTNDSKPQNWAHREGFHDDLTELVRTFRDLPSHPTVWLCRPVPAFPGAYGIRDEVIRDGVIPIIDTVAKEQKVKVIDLYAALSGNKELFPDTIHPNAEGARRIALTVYESLTGKVYKAAATAPAVK
jgi:lysophospholipase L1-like esterase